MSRRMRLRASFGFIALALVAAVSASILSIGQPVHASPADAVIKKAIGYGIAQCYKQGAMVSPITAESYNDNWGPSSIVSYGGGSYAMPTGAYNGVYSLSCAELLNGNGVNGAFPGSYSIAGVTPPENASNTSAFESFMTSMGYTKHNADGGGRCASFTYASGSDTDVTKLCAETDSQGHITGGVTYQGSGLVFRIDVTDTQVKPICTQLFDSFATNSCSAISYTKNSTDFEWLAGQVLSQLIAHRANGFLGGSYKLVEKVDFESRGNALAEYRIDNKTTAGNRALKTLTGYANENATKLTPPEQQSLLQDYLLNYYGVQNYGCDLSSDQQGVASSAGYAKIETSMFGGTLQTCWIRPTKNQNSSVAAFNSQGFFDGTSMDYDAVVKALGGSVDDMKAADKKKCNDAANTDLSNAMTIVDQYIMNPNSVSKEDSDRAQKTIDEINKIKQDHGAYWHEENGTIVCYTYTKLDGTTSDTPTDSTNPPDAPGEDPEDPGEAGVLDGCFSNAGVLGWIICPVLRLAGEATAGVYEDIAQNYLVIKSNTMTSESLRGVWARFQGYANIVFAILLVVVILSQVTGVGLSNYGIKKVLPRLIITIILVNLSFILCSVAVDLSNILGVSLNDLFKNWNTGGGISADNLNLGTMVRNTIDSIGLVGGAGAITIVGIKVVIATEAWKFMILPLLLTVLAALISILFFYVILGVRQAAIVMLVAVSPVAIVCYALPNTQKVFSRWFKIFSSLLLVFPICGILMGGSNFASRLLLSVGDVGFMYFLVAMLLSVIPLFFVPAVLKSSMSAMGNLGMKLSNMGTRFGNWSNRTIRGTRAFQDHQQEALRSSNMARDKNIMRTNRGILKRLDAKRTNLSDPNDLSGLSEREKRQYRAAQYRLNRASSRRERGVIEDMMAGVNAQREELEPGSKRYEAMQHGMRQHQIAQEAEGLKGLYETGNATKLDGSGKLDISDERAVEDEYDQLLERLDADPKDNDALARMQALTSVMMGKGENGENIIRRSLERQVGKKLKASQSDPEKKALKATANGGLRQMSSYLSSKFGGQLKSDDRDTFDMVNALAQGEAYYDGASGLSSEFDLDASGNLSHLKYGVGSAGKLSASSLAGSNDAVLDRIRDGVQNGTINGALLNSLMANVDEALNNDTIQLKVGVRKKLEEIAQHAYTQRAAGASTHTSVNQTSASIMANAGSKSLDSMLGRIQSFDRTGMDAAQIAEREDEFRAVAENARYALENNIVKDSSTAERLQDIVSAVKAQGISDFAGNTGGNAFKLNAASFKVRGSAKPEGYARRPTSWEHVVNPTTMQREWKVRTGTDASGAPIYRGLNAEELTQLHEIEAYNRQVDMRNSAKGFDPPTPPPPPPHP